MGKAQTQMIGKFGAQSFRPERLKIKAKASAQPLY
jgi:hypothetical protein